MIIRRKPTGVLNRRRTIGSLGQRLLQRSVSHVRRMVISRLPHRNPDWESQPMVWPQDAALEMQDFDFEAAEFDAQPMSDWSRPTKAPARPPTRTSAGATPSVQAKEDEPMPSDLQAIFNLHKAMGRVTGESFLHRDAEGENQKVSKVPPTAKPVQASGRYEPPPQRPVTPRNAPPTPEPADAEPPPVQRRVMSKVEYMGVRNMAEELGLTEPQTESAEDFEDDSFDAEFEDIPDALPGTFENSDDDSSYVADGPSYQDDATYNYNYDESVSAAIAQAESPAQKSAPTSSVQASPLNVMDDDPQKFAQTLIEQQPSATTDQQATQSSVNQSNQAAQPDVSSQPSSTSQTSQPDQSTALADQMMMMGAAAPSVIEESENIQRKPADFPASVSTDTSQQTETRPYTSDQLSTAIAQAEAPNQSSEVVRAKRIDPAQPTPSIQAAAQPIVYSRIVDEVADYPYGEASPLPEFDGPTFERRVTGQAVTGIEDFSPRPIENIGYDAQPEIKPPAASSPVSRVARMPETTEMAEAPEMDMPEPTVRRQPFALDEAFDAPLPKQSVSLDEALQNAGGFTESPIQEAPAPVLMPPIGRTRYRDVPLNPPSPESARPPAPTSAGSVSPMQRSIAPETVTTAVQRAEAPEASNNQTEQGLLSLLNLPVDTPIQRDGPPMPNVEVAPSVQTTAIQREPTTSPSPSGTSGGTEDSGEGEGTDKNEVEKMAHEVYRLLQRRLKVERERRSR